MPIYRDESDQQQDDSVNRIAWFFTGALIGATIAILYAPKSGKDTRRYIADVADKTQQSVGSAGDNIVDASRDMFDRGRKLVEDASELFERGRKIVRG
jgi:gas vesicle protein